MSDMNNDTAALLAEHIIRNGCSCPFDDASGIDFEAECVGFGEPGCSACILRNAGRLDRKNYSRDMLGNDLSGLAPGDHVLYRNGSRVELGLVKRVDLSEHVAYVWYSEGDTAARTPFANLIRIQNARVITGTLLGGQDAKDTLGPGEGPA